MILPGATLGLLGGGQLGRMFTIAARTMGYRVVVLDPEEHSPAGEIADQHLRADYCDSAALARLAQACSAITTEFENPPAQSLAWLAQHSMVRPDGASVAIAQDRAKEKTFLVSHGFPVAPHAIIRAAEDIDRACDQLTLPALMKTARFGYDGKGQARVASRAEAAKVFADWNATPCVLEQLLPLVRELSVVLARGEDGEVACFTPAENRHKNGILDISIVPARVSETVAERAEQIAVGIARQLTYCGVLAVEFFELPGEQLVVNEIAPRPHNSGHYTLDADATSQFEQQVRALCGLPLARPRLNTPAVMVNILGDAWRDGAPRWDRLLRHPNVKLHLYGKREPRAGRKMGHYTVLGANVEAALALVSEINVELAPKR